MKKQNLLGIMLASVTGVIMLITMLMRAFLPRFIIPKLDAPNIILLCLIALVLDHYFSDDHRRDYRLLPLYAALIFGIFPWVACFAAPLAALKPALMGAVIAAATTFLFDSLVDRLSVGAASKLAPVIGALTLYLAAQSLAGML